MKDGLPETPEEIAVAKANFTTLLEHPGWQLFVKIADLNIEVLKNQLEDGTGEEETKAAIDRIRDKLKITRDMRNTPQNMIAKWESPLADEPNNDPFPTVDDLKRDRGESVEPDEDELTA